MRASVDALRCLLTMEQSAPAVGLCALLPVRPGRCPGTPRLRRGACAAGGPGGRPTGARIARSCASGGRGASFRTPPRTPPARASPAPARRGQALSSTSPIPAGASVALELVCAACGREWIGAGGPTALPSGPTPHCERRTRRETERSGEAGMRRRRRSRRHTRPRGTPQKINGGTSNPHRGGRLGGSIMHRERQ